MKKNFRNRLLAVTAAAASSFLLLSGFDSAMTVQELQDNGRAAIAADNGMSIQMIGVADLSLDMTSGEQSQSIPVTGNMDLTLNYTFEPFAMSVVGSMSGDASAFGVSGGGDVAMYLISQDDGTGITYAKSSLAGDNAWHAASVPAEEMTKMKESVSASLEGDFSAVGEKLGIDLNAIQEKFNSLMTVSPEPENVNGVECYEVASTFTGDDIMELLSAVLTAVPNAGIDETTLSTYKMFVSGIQINSVAHYEVSTFRPVAAMIDLGASDFSMIAQLLGAMMFSSEQSTEAPTIGLTVNALNINASYLDVPESIEVPAEAAAVQPETEISISGMGDMSSALGVVPA